jgi:hypothetical protein
MGCLIVAAPLAAEITPAKVIDEKKNDIGAGMLAGRRVCSPCIQAQENSEARNGDKEWVEPSMHEPFLS